MASHFFGWLAFAFLYPQISLAKDASQHSIAADQVAAALCSGQGEGVHQIGKAICLNGFITPETAYAFTNIWEKSNLAQERVAPSLLIVNSGGGSAHDAMKIGYSMKENGVRIVVSEYCASSCANYLIPAAKSVAVLPNSIILMHGSIPRRQADFIDMRLALRNITNDDLLKDMSPFFEEWKKFPEFYMKEVVSENNFLLEMKVDEFYLTNFIFLNDTVRNNSIAKCRPKKGLALVLDENYLNRHTRQEVDYFWFPNVSQTKTLLRKFPNVSETYDLYFGFETSPRWIAGGSNARRSKC